MKTHKCSCGNDIPNTAKTINGFNISTKGRKHCYVCLPAGLSINEKRKVENKAILEKLVKENITYSGVVRGLGRQPSGGAVTALKKQLQFYHIDTSHFKGQGWKVNGPYVGRTPEEILVLRPKGSFREGVSILRKAMIKSGIPYKCLECMLEGMWYNKPLRLQIDHRNGDGLDNRKDNLRFLCPNCHSQTSTFCSLNSARSRARKEPKPICCLDCSGQLSEYSKTGVCRPCTNKRVGNKKAKSAPDLVLLVHQVKELGFSATGKLHQVSHTVVRRWIKKFNLDVAGRKFARI